MASLYDFFGLLKKLAILVLIVAIAIPIRYRSTNPQHLVLRVLHSIFSLKHCLLSDRARPTLSTEYRAIEDIIRMTSEAKRDPLADPAIVVKNLRSTFGFNIVIPKPSQCQINKEVFEHNGHTVDTYWVENHQKKFQRHADHIILYFHGGGYIMGDIDSKLFIIYKPKTNII